VPMSSEAEERAREGHEVEVKRNNRPNFKGPRKKQRGEILRERNTLKTQKWKGARPSLRRRASCKIILEAKKSVVERRKISEPKTETAKY